MDGRIMVDHFRLILVICFGMAFSCCKHENAIPVSMPQLMEVPTHFPTMDTAQENPFSIAKWEMGKQLFFDPIMSRDSSISCASCHLPQLAFADNKTVSLGIEDRLGNRNAPSLANVAFQPYLLSEGGVPTLEMQILVPIQEHKEFDTNILVIVERLKASPEYIALADAAFGSLPNSFALTRSIATFERSLISGQTPFDQYEYGQNANALTVQERNGRDLFFSDETNCSKCHQGVFLTNYAFENNGLYENYMDEGRYILTQDDSDIARFKVPSLRNVQLTAPYMHDGSITSLEAVIQHYNSGGKSHSNKSPFIKPLNLTTEEQADLVTFLGTLTDDNFIANSLFQK